MNNSNDILNELKDISPVLAGMEKVNVFTVPAGYFERLSEGVLMSVREENNLLQYIPSTIVNNVPQGYFDTLADSILNKIKAQETAAEELSALSTVVAGISKQDVLTVPVGYFEQLSTAVLNKVQMPVSAIDELNELSPVLSGIQKQQVFTVPDGYFETLPAQIVKAVLPQQAKVVSMGKRTTLTFVKYAVAAMFTGVMALGVYKYVSPNKIAEDPTVASGKQIAKQNSFDEELSKVTDDDIIKYLQVNGENIDAQAVAANVVNENELPTQEDYLTDDKALDKYLDNVDLNDLKN
jgi:uncharacterized protein YihD (DUF1040 family)